MSQINDALRRAGHSAKAAPDEVPGVPPMPAAASPPHLPPLPVTPDLSENEPNSNKSTLIQILLASLLVLSVTIAAAVNFWEKRNRSNTNTKPTSEMGAKKSLPAEAAKAGLAAKSAASAAPTNASISAAAPAITPVTVTAPAPPPRPAEPVKFPPLRLQSIFYRPSSPSVMINNKTLFVDDTIQGVLVADIQPASVTLVLSGQTNVLTLR